MADERITLDAEAVRGLVASQFPQWADLPVWPVAESGWDNLTFHLGEHMTVRLPSAQRYVAAVEKEHRLLPRLGPLLPLPIPAPLALGAPGPGYAWPWSVYGWLEGETAARERIVDMAAFAGDLAGFLKVLWRIDSSWGPPAGAHNFHRGGALAVYDAETRACIAAAGDRADGAAALALWEAALVSKWTRPPVDPAAGVGARRYRGRQSAGAGWAAERSDRFWRLRRRRSGQRSGDCLGVSGCAEPRSVPGGAGAG